MKSKICLMLLPLFVFTGTVVGMNGKRKEPDSFKEERQVKRTKIYDPIATEQLFRAVEFGNKDLVNQLVNCEGAYINARDPSGLTPLHRAVYANNRTMVNLLIDLGADVNIRDNEQQEELENGGYFRDPWWNHLSPSALTPLEFGLRMYFLRISQGQEEALTILKLLIDRGTDLNPINVRLPPLHIAATIPHGVLLILFLIEHGAYVDLLSSRGATPAGYSILYSHDNVPTLVTLLANGADVNAEVPHAPKTMLARVLAMLQANSIDNATASEVLYTLFLFGADLCTLDEENKEYLQATLEGNSPSFEDPIIRSLAMNDVNKALEELSKLTSQTLDEDTIKEYFLFALGRRLMPIVTFVVDNFGSGISQNTRDTAVFRAAQFGYDEILEYLYNSLHLESNALDTAFQLAARSNKLHTLQFLYNTGKIAQAVIQAVAHKAIKWGHLPIIMFLHRNGALLSESIDTLLLEAAEQGDLSIFDFFYSSSTISQQTLETAVLKAALKGHADIVTRILILAPYLNVQQAGSALRQRLEHEPLTEQQSARYNEIFTLLVKHQQARLATLQLESTSRARLQAQEYGIPAEIIEHITGFIR